ncbi:MAG: hypothetical protein L3J00_06405 [Thiomicrorhabdus sp.]|nr:hypothetical protein [Thiomicrorhabdus sp.]
MKKHVLICCSSVFSLFFVSTYAQAGDVETVKACLANWSQHPFDAQNPKFRTYATKVTVFGIGGKVRDTEHTPQADLVLIKPNVSVMSKSTMDLLNPNGWYCLQNKVNVMSSTTINLHCKASMTSNDSGMTVLGGNSESQESEITVLGGARVNLVGCDGESTH